MVCCFLYLREVRHENKTFDFNWTPTLEVISQGQVQKKYQYLDEDYYSIKDRSKQIKKKKEFIKEFKVFMNNYFKEQ